MDKKKAGAIAAAVLLIAGGTGAWFVFGKNRNDAGDVPAAEPATEAPTEEPTIPLYDYVPSETGMTQKAKMMLKQNKDIVGWVKVPNTSVDYPFVRDPGYIPPGNAYYGGGEYVENEYYLSHALDGSIDRNGTLFMDWRDEFGGVEEEQSENIIIYGHNMADNSMFGSLRRYRQDPSFFEEAPFVELSSNYRDYDYVICAFLITGGNWYSDFLYWNMEELDNEKEFNNYMDMARSKWMIDTGVDVKYGDKLLTLSTCYSDADNSRFIIIARRLRDGEKAGDMSTIQRTESYIKAHEPTEAPAENAEQQ